MASGSGRSCPDGDATRTSISSSPIRAGRTPTPPASLSRISSVRAGVARSATGRTTPSGVVATTAATSTAPPKTPRMSPMSDPGSRSRSRTCGHNSRSASARPMAECGPHIPCCLPSLANQSDEVRHTRPLPTSPAAECKTRPQSSADPPSGRDWGRLPSSPPARGSSDDEAYVYRSDHRKRYRPGYSDRHLWTVARWLLPRHHRGSAKARSARVQGSPFCTQGNAPNARIGLEHLFDYL